MSKGILISFEGTEGSGKSTQAKLLEKYLKSLGKKVVSSIEPGGTKVGKQIRNILLTSQEPLSKNTELFLFAADRAQHVQEVIKPALENGSIVICDRYIDSTTAYQIYGRKLPEELVRYINFISSDGILPDITFLMDISPMIGLPRAISTTNVEKGKIKTIDRFEKEKISFHEEVRKAYLCIAQNEPNRVKVIDAEKRSIDEIHQEIKKMVLEIIPK